MPCLPGQYCNVGAASSIDVARVNGSLLLQAFNPVPTDNLLAVRAEMIWIGAVAGGSVLLLLGLLMLCVTCARGPVRDAVAAVLARLDLLSTHHSYTVPGPVLSRRTPFGGCMVLLAVCAQGVIVAVLVVQYLSYRSVSTSLLPGYVTQATYAAPSTSYQVNVTAIDAAGTCDPNTVLVRAQGLSNNGTVAVSALWPQPASTSYATAFCAVVWTCAGCEILEAQATVAFAFQSTTASGFIWNVSASTAQMPLGSFVRRTELAAANTRFAGPTPSTISTPPSLLTTCACASLLFVC